MHPAFDAFGEETTAVLEVGCTLAPAETLAPKILGVNIPILVCPSLLTQDLAADAGRLIPALPPPEAPG